MMKPQAISVSYVVTVYNKARYLPHVLAGLAAQEGDFARQFVFVDDGSSDESCIILEAWAKTCPHDVIIHRQSNQGPSVATNIGFSLATGEIVKPLDGDDILAPWATKRLLDALIDLDCGAVFGKMNDNLYDPADSPDAVLAQLRPGDLGAEIDEDFLRQAIIRPQSNPSTWMARAEIIRSFGGCSPKIFVQDYSLELQLAARTRCARLNDIVAIFPKIAASRVSGNKAQILHDCNIALAELVSSDVQIPRKTARLALRRAAGRAWHFAKREGGAQFLSRSFAYSLGASLGILRPSSAAIRATCKPFLRYGKIRIPG